MLLGPCPVAVESKRGWGGVGEFEAGCEGAAARGVQRQIKGKAAALDPVCTSTTSLSKGAQAPKATQMSSASAIKRERGAVGTTRSAAAVPVTCIARTLDTEHVGLVLQQRRQQLQRRRQPRNLPQDPSERRQR